MSNSAALKAETDTQLKLACVLLLVGRYSEASQTLREGLSVTGTGDRLNAARLHNKLGWVEVDRHAFDAAASEFEAASTLLGDKAADSEVETFDLWFQVHQGLVHVHYWRDEPDKLATVVARIDSAFNGKSPPRRWQRHYFQALMLWQLAERRHRVDEEILENTRKYLEATEECSEIVDIGAHPLEVEIGWAVFCLGVCLVLYGDLDGGEERLHAALGVAERTGSAAMRALSIRTSIWPPSVATTHPQWPFLLRKRWTLRTWRRDLSTRRPQRPPWRGWHGKPEGSARWRLSPTAHLSCGPPEVGNLSTGFACGLSSLCAWPLAKSLTQSKRPANCSRRLNNASQPNWKTWCKRP